MLKKFFEKRKSDEKGMVAVIVAGFLTITVLTFSLVVDGGAQRSLSRSMQSVTDIVSLDLSRRIDGYSTTQVLKPILNNALNKTKARNPSWGDKYNVSYVLGTIDENNDFIATADDQVPGAVKVTAKQTRVWGAFAKSEASERTSIALSTYVPAYDCITIGSYAGLKDTRGAFILSVFFQDHAQTANFFSQNSQVGRLDYETMISQTLNLTNLAVRLGYENINQFQKASIRLDRLYVALYEEMKVSASLSTSSSDYSVNLNSAATFAATAQDHAPFMPMSYLLGDSVAGDIKTNMLDIYGGTLAWANGNMPINLNLHDMNNSVGHASYAQGPRLHCAKPGEVFSTSRQTETAQLEFETLGKLDNATYAPRYLVPGLMDYTGSTGGPKNSKATISLDPVTMSFQSVTCGGDPAKKTAVIDITKGNIRFDAGDNWNPTGSFTTNLNGYGSTAISFDVTISFDAIVNLAPKTGLTVSATKEQLGVPQYIHNADSLIEWNSAGTVFNSFSAKYGPSSNRQSISVEHQNKIKNAIVNSMIKELVNPNNPNSFGAWFISPLIGTSGATLKGPTVIFSGTEVRCGEVGASYEPKLVG